MESNAISSSFVRWEAHQESRAMVATLDHLRLSRPCTMVVENVLGFTMGGGENSLTGFQYFTERATEYGYAVRKVAVDLAAFHAVTRKRSLSMLATLSRCRV